jgi:hypothetical protein
MAGFEVTLHGRIWVTAEVTEGSAYLRAPLAYMCRS